MDLQTAIDNAIDLTSELADALAARRLDDCADLLPRRGDAMAAFQAAHEAAGPAERDACRSVLRVLAEADARLQQNACSVRDATGAEMRGRMVATRRMTGADADGTPACLDRKA